MSLRGAINAKCKECIYDPIAGKGTWRQQVEACTAPSCPLYPVRPTSKGTKDDSDAKPAPEMAPGARAYYADADGDLEGYDGA